MLLKRDQLIEKLLLSIAALLNETADEAKKEDL